MTLDLVALLCSRYSWISLAEPLPPRSGVANEWFGVLDALCEGLQGVTERGEPQVIAAQVVESFGVRRCAVARRRYAFDEAKVQRFIAQGRGSGTGESDNVGCGRAGASSSYGFRKSLSS